MFAVRPTNPKSITIAGWAKNPIPRQEYFPPPCKETPECLAKKENGLRTSCRCSGMWGPYNLEIVDKVKVGDHGRPLSLSPNHQTKTTNHQQLIDIHTR